MLTARPELPVYRDLEAAGDEARAPGPDAGRPRLAARAAPPVAWRGGAASCRSPVAPCCRGSGTGARTPRSRCSARCSEPGCARSTTARRSGPAATTGSPPAPWRRRGCPTRRPSRAPSPRCSPRRPRRLCGFPCVVKQRRSRRGVGVIRCAGAAELEAVLDSLWRLGEELVVQRFCPPGGVSRRVLVLEDEALGATEHRRPRASSAPTPPAAPRCARSRWTARARRARGERRAGGRPRLRRRGPDPGRRALARGRGQPLAGVEALRGGHRRAGRRRLVVEALAPRGRGPRERPVRLRRRGAPEARARGLGAAPPPVGLPRGAGRPRPGGAARRCGSLAANGRPLGVALPGGSGGSLALRMVAFGDERWDAAALARALRRAAALRETARPRRRRLPARARRGRRAAGAGHRPLRRPSRCASRTSARGSPTSRRRLRC